ncbi:MAG TPA: potassium-transporting ATPase subunit KdpB [Candidatus Sutterella merdavium]|nr:potassium-transporting ATPase subunit KdpB [Candidatus Sutterella merdavium]
MKFPRFTARLYEQLVKDALRQSFVKLDPKVQWANPVMFLVWLGALFTFCVGVASLLGLSSEPAGLAFAVSGWLWFTLLFANFAEALAEGRAHSQAASLRNLRKSTPARIVNASDKFGPDMPHQVVDSMTLLGNDLVLVLPGDVVPCDGEVVAGVASVDESAVTGESAPVIRESGGDFANVTSGTTVLSDWLVVRPSIASGGGFVERMIRMVEGAERKPTPNETSLSVLLIALTVVYLLLTASLLPVSLFTVSRSGVGAPLSFTFLTALFINFIPSTIGGLLSPIGIAGMTRLLAANVLARSGRAVEAAGDVDILLLDKTGTITFGNRRATRLYTVSGVSRRTLLEACLLTSYADDTPEGRSVLELAARELGLDPDALEPPEEGVFVPFSAQTRMSGINLEDGRQLRKGSPEAIKARVARLSGYFPYSLQGQVDAIASRGSTPLVIAVDEKVLGIIELKDVVKPDIAGRFAKLRRMGVQTVMITGDNRLTAAAIASEAGVDDFIAESTPESKLAAIRAFQKAGHLVAMTGDGANDAPALAQADVALAMHGGTQAAKEAANMVDLDSNPTKLMEVIRTGKEMMITRGALTTFSLMNDLAKYVVVVPAVLSTTDPVLASWNILGLASPESALLSAVIFNALVIPLLMPFALKGVEPRAVGASELLTRNLLVWGLSGIAAPIVGIALIDQLLRLTGFF